MIATLLNEVTVSSESLWNDGEEDIGLKFVALSVGSRACVGVASLTIVGLDVNDEISMSISMSMSMSLSLSLSVFWSSECYRSLQVWCIAAED